MSTISPAASTPPRRRGEGHWGYNSYDYYDYAPRYGHQGAPSSSGPPRGGGGYYEYPPVYGGPPATPSEYWGYDHSPPVIEGYWGSPPAYDAYPPRLVDRHMPPPSRYPRGPIHQSMSQEDSPISPYISRMPASPGGYTPRAPPRRGDFLPPSPAAPPRDAVEEGSSDDGKKKKDDPLSVLANVSAGMNDKDKKKKVGDGAKETKEERPSIPIPAPTSPLQRRSKSNPITPSTPGEKRPHRNEVTPARSLNYGPSWEYPPEGGYREQLTPPPSHFPRRRYPGYAPYSQGSPALVEQRSFESQNEAPYRDRPVAPLPPPHHYEDQPCGYWESQPLYYPPRYHYEWGEYEMPPPEDGYYRPPPPPPRAPIPPYTMVQQPRLEEKTILRKKFSWKHYPELERFLIANRDEYLKHSSMNYTAEQKQFNNWLTERLLEVAAKHNYVFDPEDFNFVAIRDRIRCYYKSYVQTARKRGLKLPEKKKD